MISPILQGAQWSQESEKILNQATENAAQNLIKKERQSQHCHKLASMLRAQGKPRVQQNELESLVAACHLANQGLESRIRKALGMAKTKEEQRKEKKEAADMEKRATKELLAQLAEAAGTSRDNAKKAMENAGGDPDLALVMLLSDPDEAKRREKREATTAKAKEQKQQSAEKAAKETEQMKKEKLAEAKKLAISVASLASLTQKMAWAQVQIELDAQINVWQTQAMMSAATGGGGLPYEETQREVQNVIATAARDPRNAVFLLEVALQQTMDRGLELCTGMLVAADGVLEAESIAESRKELAKRLKDLVKALETGKENQIRMQDQTTLVAACKLKDSTTETSVLMLLNPRNVSL
jgi:NACalpha-BTF3-like transcription factor